VNYNIVSYKNGASKQITLITTNLNEIIHTFNNIKHRLFVAHDANFNKIYGIIPDIIMLKMAAKIHKFPI